MSVIQAARRLPLLLCLLSLQAGATTLAEALAAAERYSAELPANTHQLNALNNMADAALQLPAPTLKVGIENLPVGGGNAHRFTREGMTMQRIVIMQEYVSSDKRERRSAAIRAEALSTAANAAVIHARLQRETAQAWFGLALTEKMLTAIEHIISETRQQTALQTSSVASGNASADSVLEIKLALSAMENEGENARRDWQVARAQLMALTGEEVTATSGAFPPITGLPVTAQSASTAIDQHPEVIQAQRERAMLQARASESALAAIPDIGVEVYYARRADGLDDMAGVMLSVPLPLFQAQRQDKQHVADMQRSYAADQQLAQLRRQHQAQLSALLADYQATHAIWRRQHDQVLPLLQSRVALTRAQYRAGRGSLAEWLTARRELLQGEIAAISAEKDLASRWTAIHYLTSQDAQQ
ncbi:TolC family protein [Erwinia sp. V71]|uniref:TolC family protein n=1 Tax=Erwinia sp. V71 TaxID=3369424 RepID=UPI003F62AD82